jgi:hypothetical protein
MHKKRLLKLAAYMETLEPKKYNQGRWFKGVVNEKVATLGRVVKDTYGDEFVPIKPKEGFCGAAACVLGHAPFAVPEAKLFLGTKPDYTDSTKTGFEAEHLEVYVKSGGEIFQAHKAGSVAFGIPVHHADCMFGGVCQKDTIRFYGKFTPKHVAAALRKYVETDGASMEAVL